MPGEYPGAGRLGGLGEGMSNYLSHVGRYKHTDEGVCPKCGKEMTGVAFLDGYKNGRPWHESRTFCIPCRDAQEAEASPYRDDEATKNLRNARINLRLSLAEAAPLFGLTPAELSAIEHGRVAPPRSIVDWIGKMMTFSRERQKGNVR